MFFIASSSSCTSSIANLGSPKPEKRQANSPLPPTPAVSPDIYSRVDQAHPHENSTHVSRNLEDMYAKVHKHKKRNEDDPNDTTTHEIPPYHKIHLDNRHSWSSNDEHRPELPDSSDSDADTKRRETDEHCYETLSKSAKKLSPKKCDISDIGYEEIRQRKTDNATPKLDISELGYEQIRDRNNLISEINISGPESFISNDPNYEQLSHSRISSDVDPNYEILRPQGTEGYLQNNKSTLTTKDYQPNCIDGYSVVNKVRNAKPGYEKVNNQCVEEPNYESMPSGSENYATVHQKSTESESDPNYESVKYLDVAMNEPPYERLENNSDLSEYEQISSKNSHSTPDYERIKDVASKSSDISEDRTISDNGKFSNGTDDEDRRSADCLRTDTPNVEEIIQKNTDEHMYFQV